MDAPLKEATKLVTMLRTFASEKLETQELGFEVYLRKKRMLLALSCVQRATKIEDATHPTVHSMIIRLCHAGKASHFVRFRHCFAVEGMELSTEASPAIQVLQEGISEILKGKTIQIYHQEFVESQFNTSFLHRVTAAELSTLLDPERKQDHLEGLMNEREIKPSLKECETVYRILLGAVLDAKELAETWKQRCAEWWPRSSFFQGSLMTHLSSPGATNNTSVCSS